jgi:DNA mismatch repair protein MutS2
VLISFIKNIRLRIKIPCIRKSPSSGIRFTPLAIYVKMISIWNPLSPSGTDEENTDEGNQSMNEKALKTLEYNKIIAMLAECATSTPGRKKCEELLPSDDIGEISRMQDETAAALSRLFKKGSPSFGNAHDIRGSLKRLEIGSALTQKELLQIASLLENAGRAKAYGEHDDGETDLLDPVFDSLEPVPMLSSRIRRCLISEDEVSSDASSELARIRRQIKINEDRIRSQLQEMISGSMRNYLQDAVVTVRDGRYCLPVKAEYRSQVSGMIHDQSSTGATYFIEPMAIVRLNNDIRALEIKEAREIEKILAQLSEEAAVYAEPIGWDLENMIELDFIFARAKLAMDMNATRPILNTEGRIRLRSARHPLLDKKNVVPIDIRLGDEFDLLIVTGPNTGGKTVSLKTIGLLTLMGQVGLHIPTLDRSELAVFSEVYADIGDEQSIEQSLSTFSSHMTNTVSFLEKADQRSLVLFDELGAGTDPTEGAALAIAILSYLHRQQIRTMATTHYSELKIFALQTPGVENASCEFDVSTLRPTYRLLIGVPGKSNAFAISKRLGLPDHIIDEAKAQISEQDASFEDVLSSLEQRRISLEEQNAELEKVKGELAEERRALEEKQKKFEQTRDRIVRDANEEARKILQEAKDYADQTIRDFRKFRKNAGNSDQMERKRNELRKKLEKAEASSAVKPAERSRKKPKPDELKPGDSVKVLSLNLKGIVASKPDSRGNLFVRMGIMRSKVNIDDLELIDEPDIFQDGTDARKNLRGAGGTMYETDSSRSGKRGRHSVQNPSSGKGGRGSGVSGVRMEKAMMAGTEINLLGRTVDEACAELDKFIDDAVMAHISEVRIIHGKGTGRLREGVHRYLRSNRSVKSFRLAEYGEGDAGVTIAELYV